MTRSTERHIGRMRGAATLLLTALLLMVAGLIVFHAARVGMTDQRLTANDVLAQEAIAAAQAGLERALAALADTDAGALPSDADGRISFAGPAQALMNGAAFETRIHNHGLAANAATLLEIASVGIASDGIGRRRARQLARHDPWLAHPPPSPLVAAGAIVLAAEAELRQPAGAVAAWSGGAIDAPPSILIETAATDACGGDGLCPDDPAIAALSGDRLAANFFGRPPALLRARISALSCLSCDAGAIAVDDGRPLWITGDDNRITLHGGTAGSFPAPVMLVVDGDLEVAADTVIHGLVFIRGDWLAGAGRLSVIGAVIVAGRVQAPRLSLTYDTDILERLASRGPYTRVAGSWIDF